MSTRYRSWCYTVNNYEESEWDAHTPWVISKHIKHMVFQLERGESGTPHVQGFVTFTEGKTFKAAKMHIKNFFQKEPHIEFARNIQACIDYVQKTDTRIRDPVEVIRALDESSLIFAFSPELRFYYDIRPCVLPCGIFSFHLALMDDFPEDVIDDIFCPYKLSCVKAGIFTPRSLEEHHAISQLRTLFPLFWN